MTRHSRRVYLPAGVLRRFRLPEPKAELTGRAAPRTGFGRQLGATLWVALLFALFTSLLYWLGSSEAWRAGLGQKLAAPARPQAAIQATDGARPPALTRTSGTESPNAEKPKRLAPALTGSALAGSVSAASTGGAPSAPTDPAPAPRAKPALVLDGHRLRPVVEWRDGRSERP